MHRVHHVNLSVPSGGLDDQAEFLTSMLGYERITPGPDARAMGANWWFQGDAGSQIHLSQDAEHRPALKAHPALWVGVDLEALVVRLRDGGYDVFEQSFDGDRHCYTHDPAGNFWEFIGPPADSPPA